MILDTLYLLVPLFKWYLSFPQSCIPTECVYSWDPQPQSNCKCDEKVANVLLCIRGPVGHSGNWLGPHPLPQRVTSSSSRLVSMPPTGVLQWPKGGPMGDMVNSLCAASCWRSSSKCLNWASPRSLRAIWKGGGGLSSKWGLLGVNQDTTSLPGVRVWVLEGHVPLSAT